MTRKKSAVPDDVLYKGFNRACIYKTNGKTIKPINASVRCKDDSLDKKYGCPSHCPKCGWNPAVKEQRLTKMVGRQMALKLIAQSDDLAIKTRQKINEGAYPYDV